MRVAKRKLPSIERLNVTLRLYDPNWDARKLGTFTSELVGPNTYRPVLGRKPSPGKFGNQKTDRLKIIEDFGPSPQSYDTVKVLSMCSS